MEFLDQQRPGEGRSTYYKRMYSVWPQYRKVVSLKNALAKRRKNPTVQRANGKTVEELQVLLKEAREEWNRLRPLRTVAKPEVVSEMRKQNRLLHEANMKRAAERKQAKMEFNDFMDQWKKKWSHLYSRGKHRRNSKRLELMRLAKDPTDLALNARIHQILAGPCFCYWCKKSLPKGGTVDHVTPSPAEFSEQPALL